MVHRNFEQSEEVVNNLLEMTSKPAPDLLHIHFQIDRLEAFQNQTMHQA
jgi:exocyst complex component 3